MRHAYFVHLIFCGLSPCVVVQLLLVMQEQDRQAWTKNVLGIHCSLKQCQTLWTAQGQTLSSKCIACHGEVKVSYRNRGIRTVEVPELCMQWFSVNRCTESHTGSRSCLIYARVRDL